MTVLVRRRFAAGDASADAHAPAPAPAPAPATNDAAAATGEDDVERLGAVPDDAEAAARLAAVLAARAAASTEFARELETWWAHARQLVPGAGDVHNTVSGTVSGPVVQGRDFSGPISFGR